MTQEEREFSTVKRRDSKAKEELRKALSRFIDVPINFTYGEDDEREDDTFVGTHVKDDELLDEGVLLWDDQDRWVSLEYAIDNQINEWKEEYTHASQSRDYWKRKFENMRADFEKSDDALDYWRNEFVELYNDLVRAVTVDEDNFSDGEVVDVVFDILRKYDGQSDEQTKI